MQPQDSIIAVAQLFLALSLVPMIRSHDKPTLFSSVSIVMIVLVIAATLGSLKLWFAMSTALLQAILWAVLVFQKLMQVRTTSVQKN